MYDFNLDKWESGSRGEGFVFVFDLVSQILLHSFLLKHLLFPLSPKQDPRRNGDGHCVLWLWLQIERGMIESGLIKLNGRNRKMSGQERLIEMMSGKHRRDERFERSGPVYFYLW